MAEAFDREQSFRTLSPEEGVKARDLAGRARKEHPPPFAQQRGGFGVTASRIALHVFGFEQRLQLLLFFCLAVRYPSPRRGEGRAEYDASFAQRPPGEQRKDAARGAGRPCRLVPVACREEPQRVVRCGGMQSGADAFAQAASGAGVRIRHGVAEPFGVFRHADALRGTPLRTGSAAAAVAFVAQGEHIVVERAEFLFEGTLFPGYFRLPGLIFFCVTRRGGLPALRTGGGDAGVSVMAGAFSERPDCEEKTGGFRRSGASGGKKKR